MGAINWQQFGLKTDPYDIQPLVEGGELPLEQAFIGREREKEFLEHLFAAENRLCLTICGDVGVGKTSLSNFQKYVWKYRRPKLLFSFRREIEASAELLSKRAFVLEVIASVLREIRLLQPELLADEALASLRSLADIIPHSPDIEGITSEIVCVKYSYKLKTDMRPSPVWEIMSFYLDKRESDGLWEITSRVCEKKFKEGAGERNCPIRSGIKYCI